MYNVSTNLLRISQVTGGGSGLGREICLELARRGCKVAVVDVNSKGCYETVELLSKIPRCTAKAYKVSHNVQLMGCVLIPDPPSITERCILTT